MDGNETDIPMTFDSFNDNHILNLPENIIKPKNENIEEDYSEDVINSRRFSSKKTSPSEELGIKQFKDISYILIRFDASFKSELHEYNWVIYHTPTEIRNNIKAILGKIQNPSTFDIKQLNNDNDIIKDLDKVNDFYIYCFSTPEIKNQKILTDFFNIGKSSFLKRNNGNKPFEGLVEIRSDNYICGESIRRFFPCCLCTSSKYQKKWLILNDDHLSYGSYEDSTLSNNLNNDIMVEYHFDKNMKIENDGANKLKLNNNSVSLNIKFKDFLERELWKSEIEKKRRELTHIIHINKYQSYTHRKDNNICSYFVDAKTYFRNLYTELMSAKSTIYISDYWLSPELFLLRLVETKAYIDMAKKEEITRHLGNDTTRLIEILDFKARTGIKIYILIYNQNKLKENINSKHTETILTGLHENIKVLRHPLNEPNFLWAHNEKLVIIDRMIGYTGGISLCWGRYDTKNHNLFDTTADDNDNTNEKAYEFPFIDYSNERISDIKNVEKYTNEYLSRKNDNRLPWHDVQCKIVGPAAGDMANHFIKKWNYIIDNDSIPRNNYISNDIKINDFNMNANKGNFGNDEYRQMMNNFMKDKEKIDDDHLLIKKGDLSDSETNKEDKSQNKNIELDNKISTDIIYKEYISRIKSENSFQYLNCSVQVLRSASQWNLGLNNTENSILRAYYDLITNAEHYIYIENESFISKSWADEEKNQNSYYNNDIVKNEIAFYIRKRIERAYQNKENFKVFIFLPLLPKCAGDPQDNPNMQIILKHTYATIWNNNGLSLIEQLEDIMGDKWNKYLRFYSLRNHDMQSGNPKTEMIYIHSNIMIVDDTKVLIGSASINDRSMLGNRNSEFAVIIEGKKELKNEKTNKNFIMNGNENYKAASFVVNLRKELMAEHLGYDEQNEILDDPVSESLFNEMNTRAENNTIIYKDIFGCYPHNDYSKFEQYKNTDQQDISNIYNILKDKINGHIVEYPYYFLKDENLGKAFFSEDNLIPEHNFT